MSFKSSVAMDRAPVLLGAFKQTLPNGKSEGVGKLLNASA